MVRVRMLEKLLVAALCLGIPAVASASGKSGKSGKTVPSRTETETEETEIKAKLTPPQGQVGKGKASYEVEGASSEFELEAKLPTLAVGTVLTVSVLASDGGSPPTITSSLLGTATVGKGGKLKLKVTNPTVSIAAGQTVVVSNDADPMSPVVVLSGVLK